MNEHLASSMANLLMPHNVPDGAEVTVTATAGDHAYDTIAEYLTDVGVTPGFRVALERGHPDFPDHVSLIASWEE